MQRLTLCMIVKNEEAFLDGCLASARDVVDGIVIVDTGCTDGTLAIARKYGARIVPHVWNDDFAAARNAALEHVPGGFVLVLDADERLGPGAKRALRKALARNDFDCGLLPLHDASRLEATAEEVLSGRARRQDPQLLPRLLRRTPDLRWSGVVHEQVTDWARKHARIAVVDAPIVHYGAVPELRAARAKSDRNLRLLEKRAQLEPENPIVLAYLARELERKGETMRALETARHAWLATRARDGERPDSDPILPVTLLAYLAIRSGEIEEALRALTQARLWSEGHPNLDLLEGLAHEQRALRAATIEDFAADLQNAKSYYEALQTHGGKLFASEVMPGALGATGQTRLGTVELLLGEPAAAQACFERALQCDPSCTDAKLGLAEAELDGGRPARALSRASELLSTQTPDAWLLGAAAALALGSRDDARLFAERARALAASTAWGAPHRRGRLDELLGEFGAPQDAPPTEVQLRASVVIPAYNRLDLLRQVLEGFLRQRDVAAFELIVVDDGSQPPVREVWSSLPTPPSWRLIEHEHNRGRGAALNSGLDAACGDVVIFCDSDIEPGERFVAEHLQFHSDARSELATCLGALEYGVDAGAFGALMGARSNPRLDGVTKRVDWTQWFTDNWSFQRRLLSTRGLHFDERFRVWGWEELDLARQLEGLGATNTLVANARGRHLKPASLEGMLGSFARSIPNLELIASKWPRERHVHGWISTNEASPAALEAATAALTILWARVETLHENGLIDVRSSQAARTCAAFLSDLVFRVGVTRGYVTLGRPAVSEATRVRSERVLEHAVLGAARALAALEATLQITPAGGDWSERVAELGRTARAA